MSDKILRTVLESEPTKGVMYLDQINYPGNAPLDSKSTPVASYDDLKNIDRVSRYVGMVVTVTNDSHSGGEQTDYWLVGGTADDNWVKKEYGGGGGQLQVDWNESDETSVSYIKNKPSLPQKPSEVIITESNVVIDVLKPNTIYKCTANVAQITIQDVDSTWTLGDQTYIISSWGKVIEDIPIILPSNNKLQLFNDTIKPLPRCYSKITVFEGRVEFLLGTNFIDPLEDGMKFTIDTTAGGLWPTEDYVNLPFYTDASRNFDMVVDWGDGASTTILSTEPLSINSGGNATHVYTTPGKYQITIKNEEMCMPYIGWGTYGSPARNALKLFSVDTPLYKQWYAGYRNEKINKTFKGATNLTKIHKDTFRFFKGTSTLNSAFEDCRSLEAVPEGLFDDMALVTTADTVFSNCISLTNLPKGLFKDSNKITTMGNLLDSCRKLIELPTDLLQYTPLVTNLSYAFYNLITIKEIPDNFLSNNIEVENMDYAFASCENITTVPNGLFGKLKKLTKIKAIFKSCKNLVTIPDGLFDITIIKNFTSVFEYCYKLIISPTLFAYPPFNIDGYNFERMVYRPYYHQPQLGEAPALWDYPGTPISTSNCFSTNCTNEESFIVCPYTNCADIPLTWQQ